MSKSYKKFNQNKSTNFGDGSFFIVALGASAGGLRSLEELFAHIPKDNPATFIVIQHLSANFKSLIKELLERKTVLPVHEIESGITLESGTIYVMPVKLNVTVEGGKFCLQEVDSEEAQLPINLLFKSIATAYKNQAIGVLLSGTGNDGTEGLRAISQAGGIAMIQSPETTEFSAMSQNALPTGLVDEILSPQDLARTITEIIRLSSNQNLSDAKKTTPEIDPIQLKQILRILQQENDLDFFQYKTGTLSRRIYHRCSLAGMSSIQEYIEYLENFKPERKLLIQDFLISSTKFFRDGEAWSFIENQVLPSSIQSLEPEQELRIWVAGCASGEEAYTLAILVDEAIARSQKSIQTKIFATDIDAKALEVAAQGIYSKTICQHISPDRLQKYFTEKADRFAVKPQLRKMLIFAPHNLIKNPGFSKMHLIICRNVLIYLQSGLQKQVLGMLHFSLVNQGILFLGSAEILNSLEGEFIAIHPKWKIYQKRRDIQLSLLPMVRQPMLLPEISRKPLTPRQKSFEPLLEDIFELYFGDRRTCCLLLDIDNNLVHTFYDGAKLLKFPMGEPNLDVMSIFPRPLQLPLTTALHRAKREKKSVLYSGITITHNDRLIVIDLKVAFHQKDLNKEPFLIVLLEESAVVEKTKVDQAYELDIDAIQQIQELQYELQQTRENLQVTIEELETTNEEQQAANEEQMASNEELQSTNEELHSVNEELYTVNTEYQSKIQALTELNNDMDNLLRSTDIGVVFLDRELKIRKFTPAATKAINLLESDIHRPISHLSYNFKAPELIQKLTEVLATQKIVNQEVTIEATGDHLLMRIHPYMSDRDECEGLAIAFIDINEIKQFQTHLEYLYTTSPVGLCLTDEEFRFVRVNQVLAEMNGVSASEHIGRTVREVIPELADQLEPLYRQVMQTGEPIKNQEIYGKTNAQPEVERFWTIGHYRLELPADRPLYGTAFAEVTELKKAQNALQESKKRLRQIVDLLPLRVFAKDARGKFILVNQFAADAYGVAVDQIEGQVEADFISDPGQLEEKLAQDRIAIETGEQLLIPEEVEVDATSTPRIFQTIKAPLPDPESQESGVLGISMDITDIKQVEEKLRQSSEQLQLITNALPAWISYVDEFERYGFNNATYETWFGRSAAEISGLRLQEVLGEPIYLQVEGYVRAALGGETVNFDMEWSIPNLGNRWVQVSYIPHVVNEDEVKGFFALIADISDRKALDQMKDEFISVISHELRTPLTSVQGSLKLLLNQIVALDSERGQHLLNIAAQNTQRLVTFINDVLDLERLQSFKTRLNKKMVQVSELMRQSVQQIETIADAAEISLCVFPQEIEFYADGDRLIRVMVNLLNNAIKFSEKGASINFVVEQITGKMEDLEIPENNPMSPGYSTILFKVQDYGRGIPADKIDTVFESFYQVDASDSRQKGGSGLGLTICRNIIQQHGGKIWVESTLNVGTTFYFAIPLINHDEPKNENQTNDI